MDKLTWEDHKKSATVDDGVMLPTSPDVLSACKSFQFNEDDVLIASYPKTGTTWVREILYLVCHDGDTGLLRKIPYDNRVHFMELNIPGRPANVEELAAEQGQRLMFSHLRLNVFEEKIRQGRPKVILVMRHPKDALTSFYHFHKKVLSYPHGWDQFFELIRRKETFYGDFIDWYVDWSRVKGLPNVLFLRYEDMKQNSEIAIRQIASLLGKTLSDKQVEDIVEATSFDVMKKNAAQEDTSIPHVSKSDFLRKGNIGDWKNYFTEEESDYIDRRQEESLKPLGLAYV